MFGLIGFVLLIIIILIDLGVVLCMYLMLLLNIIVVWGFWFDLYSLGKYLSDICVIILLILICVMFLILGCFNILCKVL